MKWKVVFVVFILFSEMSFCYGQDYVSNKNLIGKWVIKKHLIYNKELLKKAPFVAYEIYSDSTYRFTKVQYNSTDSSFLAGKWRVIDIGKKLMLYGSVGKYKDGIFQIGNNGVIIRKILKIKSSELRLEEGPFTGEEGEIGTSIYMKEK